MPGVEYWYQGATLSRATAVGTVVVKNWDANGRYPNLTIQQAINAGQPINHTAVVAYIDEDGNAHLYSQNPGPIREDIVPADQLSQWSEVRVDESNGPYESTPSDRSVANGNGGAPLSEDEQARARGLAWLQSMHNPYWGYLPTTFTTNFAGGRAGLPGGGSPWANAGLPLYGFGPIQGSIFGPGNWYGGLDPMAAVGATGSGPKPNGVP
jgi:hypothetical protein